MPLSPAVMATSAKGALYFNREICFDQMAWRWCLEKSSLNRWTCEILIRIQILIKKKKKKSIRWQKSKSYHSSILMNNDHRWHDLAAWLRLYIRVWFFWKSVQESHVIIKRGLKTAENENFLKTPTQNWVFHFTLFALEHTHHAFPFSCWKWGSVDFLFQFIFAIRLNK